MNKEVKAAWIAALRSGKYTQGTGSLRKDYPYPGGVTHCCLGVLCELYLEAHPGEHWVKNEVTSYMEEMGPHGMEKFSGVPPPKVMKWARLEGDSTISMYYRLNDAKGASFDRIAEVIEAEE